MDKVSEISQSKDSKITKEHRESYSSELRLAKYFAKNIHNQKLRISDKQNENKLQLLYINNSWEGMNEDGERLKGFGYAFQECWCSALGNTQNEYILLTKPTSNWSRSKSVKPMDAPRFKYQL